MRGFRTAALVDGDVDDHRAALHRLDHRFRDQLRRRRPRHEHRTDHEIGREHLFLHGRARRIQRRDRRAELLLDRVKPLDVDIEDRHIGFEPDRHVRGIDARNAAAEHDDLGRRNPCDAAEQQAAPALRDFEAVRASLDRHAACNFGHGCKQRQPAARVGHRLVGDRRTARCHQRLGLIGIGRQMQIGEQRLPLASASCTPPAAALSPSRSSRLCRRSPPPSSGSSRQPVCSRRRKAPAAPPLPPARTRRAHAPSPHAQLTGVMPMRYSWFLISFGTPMRMGRLPRVVAETDHSSATEQGLTKTAAKCQDFCNNIRPNREICEKPSNDR